MPRVVKLPAPIDAGRGHSTWQPFAAQDPTKATSTQASPPKNLLDYSTKGHPFCRRPPTLEPNVQAPLTIPRFMGLADTNERTHEDEDAHDPLPKKPKTPTKPKIPVQPKTPTKSKIPEKPKTSKTPKTTPKPSQCPPTLHHQHGRT